MIINIKHICIVDELIYYDGLLAFTAKIKNKNGIYLAWKIFDTHDEEDSIYLFSSITEENLELLNLKQIDVYTAFKSNDMFTLNYDTGVAKRTTIHEMKRYLPKKGVFL